MKMMKAFKYRIYPTAPQEACLRQQAGNCRFVWNKLLEANSICYKENGNFLWYYGFWDEIKRLREEYDWLNLADVHSYQQIARHLDKALKKLGKNKRYPKFKSKHDHNSIPFDRVGRINKNSIEIPKLKVEGLKARQARTIKMVKHRSLEGKPKSMTVSLDVDQWFVSILCEIETDIQPKQGPTLGVDLGLESFVTCSDGTKIDNPRYLRKTEKRLKRKQKQLSKKQKGSNNRNKARRRLARLHRKVRRQRSDFLHKTSHELIAKAGRLCLEDLNVKALQKSRLSKSVSDVGWGEFVRQLEYKAWWDGVELRKADRFFPSSKLCSGCGSKKVHLQLSDRTYTCSNCGLEIDRDLNAAINLSTVGTTGIDACGDTSVGGLDSSKSRHVSSKQEKELVTS